MTSLQLTRHPLAQTAARLTVFAVVVGLLFVPLAPTAARATPAAEPVSRDPRFGLNEAWRAGDAADRAGAGWSRVLFWWSEMQKDGPGSLNLFATDQDGYIFSETARGRELAGAVLNTPGWASTDGSRNGVPKGLYLAWDDPGNTWGQFMRLMAEHYKGRIDTWIVWNEVDIDGGQWHTWNGSVDDYVQLQKVAYKAIKAGNPNATVLPFGAAWWYDYGATVTRMLDGLAADPDAKANNYYFDVANLHLYSRAADIPRVVGWYRDQLAARGMSKPIWIVETNAIPYDDAIWKASKANFRATMDEQASYMIQAFSTYLGLGIQRVSVNRAIDGTDFEAGGEPFGLLRNDGSTRPAFTAYQVVTRYFSGVTDGTYSHSADGTTKVVLKRGSDQITVLWSMSPSGGTATVDSVGLQALRVNKRGEATPILSEGSHYTIALRPATANSNSGDPTDYVVGGEPVILIERPDGDVMAAVRSLDDNPAPGQILEASSAGSDESAGSQGDGGSKKATPTPRKAAPTPTPTPRRR